MVVRSVWSKISDFGIKKSDEAVRVVFDVRGRNGRSSACGNGRSDSPAAKAAAQLLAGLFFDHFPTPWYSSRKTPFWLIVYAPHVEQLPSSYANKAT